MEQSFITPLDTGTLQCGPAPVGSPYCIYRFRHEDGGGGRWSSSPTTTKAGYSKAYYD